MRKIALIIGHNEKSKGAYSACLGEYEMDFWTKVSDRMIDRYREVFALSDSKVEEIKKTFLIFRVPNTGYSKEMAEVVERINKEKFDIAVELHFNAGGGNGTTVLYWHKSSNGKKLAELFQDVMVDNTGVKRRELIQIKGANQNGAYGIMHSKCPYVLLEPFFGDSESDCSKVSVDILADVLFKYFNIINNVSVVDEPTQEDSAMNDLRVELLEIRDRLDSVISGL